MRISSAPRPEIFLGIYIPLYFGICDPPPVGEDQPFVPQLFFFITLFLLSQINTWSLRNFVVDMQVGVWRKKKNRIHTGNQTSLWTINKGSLLR